MKIPLFLQIVNRILIAAIKEEVEVKKEEEENTLKVKEEVLGEEEEEEERRTWLHEMGGLKILFRGN